MKPVNNIAKIIANEGENEAYITVMKNVMSTENGRQFICMLLNKAGIFEKIVDEDPYKLNYRLGLKNGFIDLFFDIQVNCPEDFLKMTSENIEIQKRVINKLKSEEKKANKLKNMEKHYARK